MGTTTVGMSSLTRGSACPVNIPLTAMCSHGYLLSNNAAFYTECCTCTLHVEIPTCSKNCGCGKPCKEKTMSGGGRMVTTLRLRKPTPSPVNHVCCDACGTWHELAFGTPVPSD